MIFSGSYFNPKTHHGDLVSISLSNPPGYRQIQKLNLFAPSSLLLCQWEKSQKLPEDWRAYTQRYWQELLLKKEEVYAWLESLDPDEDKTLLCWEHAGNYCHRNLVLDLVRKKRPDCYGGKDVEAVITSTKTINDFCQLH